MNKLKIRVLSHSIYFQKLRRDVIAASLLGFVRFIYKIDIRSPLVITQKYNK